MTLSLCKFYYLNHPQVVWPIYYVQTIVLGNQINCFPLRIKFKVQESSVMEFLDWVQVKEKILYVVIKPSVPCSGWKSRSEKMSVDSIQN